ncbi:MAG: response regulator [Opitutaceae bacterium]|nr:response regulator [Opitutaceae bacterium]
MNEVSCRMMLMNREIFIANGLDWRAICAISGRTEEHVFNSRRRIDWDEYVGVCDRALAACGSDERFSQMARKVGSGAQMLSLRRFARACLSAERFYRALGTFHCATNFNNVVTPVVKGLPDGKVSYEVFLKAGAAPCYAFFLSAKGALEGLPCLLGYEPAKIISFDVTDSYAKAIIEPPQFRSIATRLVALIEAPLRLLDAHSMARSHEKSMLENFQTISQQKRDLESVFEGSSEAIVIVGGGRVLHANRAFSTIMQLPASASPVGRESISWLHEDQVKELRAWASHTKGASGRKDITLTTELGNQITVELASPRTVSWDSKSATLWMFRDVSAEREMANALALASENEQRKIAHDLHDGLGQEMTALGLHLKILQNHLEAEAHPAAGDAARLVEMASRVARHARDIAHGLAPHIVLELGLVAALRWLASHVREMFQIDVTLEVRGDDEVLQRVPQDVTIAVYRASQEIFTNARKHGRARSCRVSVVADAAQITFVFIDDGIGLSQCASGPIGLGLRIMRHRMESLGGDFSIGNSVEGAGVSVTLRVPLHRRLYSSTRERRTVERHGAQASRGVVGAPESSTAQTNGRHSVMVLDDHAVVRDGIEALLAQTGRYSVVAKFASAAEALSSPTAASIVIVDLMLGDKSGLEVISQLRSREPAPRVVAFSMGARELYEVAALQAGADAFVSKHDSARELVTTLDQVVKMGE